MYKSPFHFLVIFYLNLFIPFSYAAPPLACSNDYANDLRVNELNVAGSTANANNSGEGYIELYVLQPIILNNKTISYFNNGQLAPAVSLNTINAKVYLPDGSSQTANNYSNSVVPVNSFIVYPENLFSSSTAFTKNSGEILILDTTSNTVIHYFNYSNNNPGSKWDVADSSPSCKTSFDPGNADDNGICSKPDGSNTWAICNASEGTSNDDNGGGGSSNDCTSFSFDIPTLTACKPASSIAINCGSDLQGDQTFKLWSTYSAPSSGSEQVKVNGTIISTSSPGTDITLNFTDGSASFDIQYDDAGQVKLDASFDNNGSLISSDSTFISKPAALVTYNEDANADCATADASCSVFKKAGETFNLKVKAVCWDDDADYSNNPVTANFELVNIPINHTLVAPAGGNNGSISTSSFNFSSSDNGIHTVSQSVSEVGAFTFSLLPPSYLGETLTTISSSNIGRFIPNLLKVTNSQNGAFADACSTFTYSGQGFSYQTPPSLTVTAYNYNADASLATITTNYTGAFASYLNVTDFNVTTPTSDSTQLGVDLSNKVNLNWTPASATLNDNNDGSHTFIFGNDLYTYTHENNSQIALFSSVIDLVFTDITDSDEVSASVDLPYTLQPTATEIRFGRLNLENVHGSELTPLDLPIYTEYFDGNSFITNTADNCTTYTLPNSNCTDSTSNNDFSISDPIDFDCSFATQTTPVSIGAAGSIKACMNNTKTCNGAPNYPQLKACNGITSLTISDDTISTDGPGASNTGYIDITSSLTTNLPWLTYNWDNTDNLDSHNECPSGRATFGIYKGNSKQIYFREVY